MRNFFSELLKTVSEEVRIIYYFYGPIKKRTPCNEHTAAATYV